MMLGAPSTPLAFHVRYVAPTLPSLLAKTTHVPTLLPRRPAPHRECRPFERGVSMYRFSACLIPSSHFSHCLKNSMQYLYSCNEEVKL